MAYFVTGATGFIGGRLVQELLANRKGTIYCLVRDGSQHKLDAKIKKWGTTKRRVVPIVGDLGTKALGLSKGDLELLSKNVEHVFHLAAIYDITADEESQRVANIDGTRHVVQVVNKIKPKLFHHTSSIAAGGQYDGWFDEKMLDEATGLDNPYFATKHHSERIARDESKVTWRVYRPGIVVGDSETGEIDKVDGPYYFFKMIQKMRSMLPQWFPMVGLEGRKINVVPVDFIAKSMDHIAHLEDKKWDNKVFHLVDPDPHSVGEVMNFFASAAHAPTFSMRLDYRAFDLIPNAAKKVLGSIAPIQNAKAAVLGDLGIPEESFKYVNWKTKYRSDHTQEALEGSGISVPDLADYAYKLWDFWERNLDADLFRDHSLRGTIEGKVVMVTGASDGIGEQVALDAAGAGAHVLLVSRTREKLEAVRDRIADEGGIAHVYPCDISDLEDIDRMVAEVTEEHGGIDILVNNAGRSIRRGVKLSYERFHDFERTMQLNYFGTIRLIIGFMPSMIARGGAHVINVSSIGVQTGAPRFSAYVASKAALDAFTRVIGSEVIDDGIHFTTVYMPLVRTKMIAPTGIYQHFPAISPEEASAMVTGSFITQPKRVATGVGNFGQTVYAIAPKVMDQLLHTAYKLFPDSSAAKGDGGKKQKAGAEGVAFAHLLKGVHW
ncbi:MAG: NAD(P)-dependent dehydrogenase (short-subunit alcohol dehydrogenase family) [Glaciecola sp.]|jgi:NAD(P)-dependent dehydrogenase (short-subunit alcohol dehydrogenase family)